MPLLEESIPRHRDADAEYYYRRPLSTRELLPAIGVAIGAGLFAFYITRLLLQRTPLKIERSARRLQRGGSESRERPANA